MLTQLLDYDMPLWRPPSEGRSLIFQATYGRSHNRCTFCRMYRSKRFRARPIGEVVEELERIASQAGSYIRRVFLADGDPMALPAERMIPILEACGKLFPRLERVTTYATPRCHHRCRD